MPKQTKRNSIAIAYYDDWVPNLVLKPKSMRFNDILDFYVPHQPAFLVQPSADALAPVPPIAAPPTVGGGGAAPALNFDDPPRIAELFGRSLKSSQSISELLLMIIAIYVLSNSLEQKHYVAPENNFDDWIDHFKASPDEAGVEINKIVKNGIREDVVSMMFPKDEKARDALKKLYLQLFNVTLVAFGLDFRLSTTSDNFNSGLFEDYINDITTALQNNLFDDIAAKYTNEWFANVETEANKVRQILSEREREHKAATETEIKQPDITALSKEFFDTYQLLSPNQQQDYVDTYNSMTTGKLNVEESQKALETVRAALTPNPLTTTPTPSTTTTEQKARTATRRRQGRSVRFFSRFF